MLVCYKNTTLVGLVTYVGEERYDYPALSLNQCMHACMYAYMHAVHAFGAWIKR